MELERTIGMIRISDASSISVGSSSSSAENKKQLNTRRQSLIMTGKIFLL